LPSRPRRAGRLPAPKSMGTVARSGDHQLHRL
jgi:hypothetical protein